MRQIPNPKLQIPRKNQNHQTEKMKKTTRRVHHLDFGNWDLFGIWSLGFGICGGALGF
jgi:hypothetical protein